MMREPYHVLDLTGRGNVAGCGGGTIESTSKRSDPAIFVFVKGFTKPIDTEAWLQILAGRELDIEPQWKIDSVASNIIHVPRRKGYVRCRWWGGTGSQQQRMPAICRVDMRSIACFSFDLYESRP